MKINKLFNIVALSMVAIAGTTLTSCSDDDTADVQGNPNNLVYFKANASNTFEGTVVHTPVGDFSGVSAVFPVKILRAASTNTTVTATVDTSLVSEYNKAHNTSYVALPSSAVEASGMTVTIPKDSVNALDSVKVSLKQDQLASLTAPAYLLAVRISQVNGDGVGSIERGIGYVVVDTKTTLMKSITSPDEMTGTLIDDYSGWTASYDTGTEIDASAIFNGSVEDGPQLRADGNNGTSKVVVVDMQTSHKVSGVRVARYYKSYYGGWWIDEYYFSSVKVEVSDDKINWTDLGTATDAEMPKGDGYQYITYYAGVPARYIRLSIESGESSVSSLAELGVYTTD